MDDPMIVRWLRKKKKKNRNREISKSSWEIINFWPPRYFAFHKKTPTQMIEEAMADPENEVGEDDLVSFFDYQIKVMKRKHNFAYTGTWSVMRGFYSLCGVNTKHWSPPNKIASQTSKDDMNYPMFKHVRKRWILNTKLLRPFLESLNRRNRTICVSLLQTGMDFEDLNMITINDILKQPDDGYLYWTANRLTTHEPFVSIFGQESTALIRDYIQYERRDRQSDDEPIFVSDDIWRREAWKIQNIWEKREAVPKGEILPFVPVSQASLSQSCKRAFLTLKIPIQKGVQQPFRPKRFRKIFRNTFSKRTADDDLRNAFMGHDGGASQYYLEMPKEELIVHYREREDLLTVFAEVKSDDDYQDAVKAFQTLNVEYEAAKRDAAGKTKELADFRKKYKQDMKILYQKTLPAEVPKGVSPDAVKFMFTLMKNPKLLEKYMKENN